MAMLTEPQTILTQLLESSIGDQIDGIGVPALEGDRIIVDFQYGTELFTATIDPDAGTITY